MIYVVTRSIDQGRAAGVVSVLGIQIGTLVHVAAATFGLSALLVSSALAFSLVKYAGAAYLLYLGISTLRRSDPPADTPALVGRRKLSQVFAQGVLVNVLNPKTALFFLAFLPQFVDPDAGPVAVQVGLLGLLLMLLGTVSDGAYALLAARAGRWLRGNVRFGRVQRRVSAGVYLSLGTAAAVSGSSNR